MESERRAKSDMEHEALLRLEAAERAASAEKAEEEAKEARRSAEMLAESLQIQVYMLCSLTTSNTNWIFVKLLA